jgi:GH15 family glucan-1,4-alpha-glucosidase
MRDATFALWGLYTLGFEWEANDYVAFLRDLVERDRGDLQIVYGIDGRRELDEHVLDHLNGYQGARPVRIGNGAYQQAQHDVWGVILDSIYLHTKSRDRLDDRTWKMARQQVERALERWREPDRGIWEVRGEPKHFTSSKMMCWVAADRGARLATLREDKDLARTWRKAADEIHADICANAVDDRGVFCQHYETTALDASLLLMPLPRFLPPDDPRIRATVLAIADELTRDGLVLRYQVDETDDGLSGEEGTFTICSFWLVSALSEIGGHERARDICEQVLSYASPLLLYGEEIDPCSGRHLGNFPQAFTHLALINAVMHVIRKEQAAQRRAMAREVPEGRRNGQPPPPGQAQLHAADQRLQAQRRTTVMSVISRPRRGHDVHALELVLADPAAEPQHVQAGPVRLAGVGEVLDGVGGRGEHLQHGGPALVGPEHRRAGERGVRV